MKQPFILIIFFCSILISSFLGCLAFKEVSKTKKEEKFFDSIKQKKLSQMKVTNYDAENQLYNEGSNGFEDRLSSLKRGIESPEHKFEQIKKYIEGENYIK